MKDRETYEQLVSSCYELVYKYCFVKLAHDDTAATECTNDTFMILADKIDSLDLGGNVAGWLIKTARFCILKYNEREKRYLSRIVLPEDDDVFERIEDDSPGVEERVIAAASESETLKRIENALDPAELELFRLRYIDEQNPTQIAAALELPYTTARMRLKRLEAKLRRTLSGDGAPPRSAEKKRKRK